MRAINVRLQRAGDSFAYRDFRYFYAAVVTASMGNQGGEPARMADGQGTADSQACL